MGESIVQQGVELMVFGMGTVVTFLSLLVVATGLMSRLVGRYFPEPESEASPVASADNTVSVTLRDEQLVAVISAAIRRHRDKRLPPTDT